MDPVEELKALYGTVLRTTEGGMDYFLIPGLALPSGCTPARVDALLCPTPRDGYTSRLYFAARVACRGAPNWNGSFHLLDKAWHAFSWRVPPGDLRLAQLVSAHLEGLR